MCKNCISNSKFISTKLLWHFLSSQQTIVPLSYIKNSLYVLIQGVLEYDVGANGNRTIGKTVLIEDYY